MRVRRLLSALVMLAVLVGTLPATAFAAVAPPVTAQVSSGCLRDPYDVADDTMAGARDITPKLGDAFGMHGFGDASVEETHTLYGENATQAWPGGTTRDEDWFKVRVTDVSVSAAYLIEAKAREWRVDPVIEVYRSGAHPTPAGQLWQTTDATRPGSGCIAANDDGPWFFGGSASASFVPTQTGTYYFRVRPGFGPEHDALPLADGERLEGFARGAGPYTVRLKVGSVTRLALADTSRVQTAVEMSREAFPDTSLPLFDPTGDGTVVVANGWNYPDAIAGSTLAGVVRGPLLITHPDRLDGVVAHEIRRLGAKRVFVLGSSAAVSTAVKTQLEAVVGAGNVLRVSGPPRTSRVDTAIAIAKRAKAENPSSFSKLALICNGWSFADALAASPVAAYGAAPILLTHGSVLDTSVADAIRDLGVTDALVVGSTGAVSRNVENALKAKLNTDGKAHVLRIGGQTRYATAAAIATWATGRHGTTQRIGTVAQPSLLPALDWRRVGFATGVDYPDALGGGVFCGLKGHPLLLTPGASVSPYILDIYGTLPAGKKAYFSESSAARNFIGKATRSYVLGGEAAVTGPTLTTLDLLLGLQP